MSQEIEKPRPKRGSFSSWRGNKYPEVKLRGFYSDITSHENLEKTKVTEEVPQVFQSYAWESHKEKHVPLVRAFEPIELDELKIHLGHHVHGATTEIIKITDFTENGYLPKCFLPFYTPPGQLPRKVQIDRLKRLYLSMDISEILKEKNLEPEVIMPVHRPADEIVLLNVPGQDPAPFPPFLPLQYFDNEDFEVWTPEEWLNKGIEHKVYKPLPARALLPNVPSNLFDDPKSPSLKYTWQNVGVIDFDSDRRLWLVQKLTPEERVLDENGNPIINKAFRPDGSRRLRPNQYWIPRIQLQFLAEDPRNFADRIEAAFYERKIVENFLRYQFYVDSMPIEGVIDLDQVSFRRSLDFVRNGVGLKTLPDKNKEDTILTLEKEVNVDFKRTMNKITFNEIVASDEETFGFVSVPPPTEEPIREKGCVTDVPEYDFDGQFYNFSFVSLLTRKEAIDALSKVRVECNKVAAMSLFQIPNKHMKLEEFDQAQTQQTYQTSLYLKDSWINTLKAGIRSSFLDSGKGWFNIKEKDWGVYQISKLKKFMELVKFSMQDSLRFLVQDSLVNYTQMIVDSCWQVVDLKEDFSWPENDLINSYIKPKKNSVFFVELQIDKNGPRYNINYESFENTLCSLFEKAISSTQAVPQLEKYVMEDIFWSGTPLLESVGNLEPNIVELKETIIHMMHQSQIPLKAYAKSYDKYTNLMNLNIENYIKDFERTEKTIEQVRDETRMHLKEKEIIEKVIPMSITIGPFYISTSKIRENLSSKRKLLAEAVLNYQTKKVRNKAEDVNNSFRDIQRKLFEKPNNMEELHEHREWMKSIPGLLEDKKEDITAVMEEYDLLDEFIFNLSNEDFMMKWGLLSWPWKLNNMSQQVEEQHVEDEERFKKLQIQDTANLNDRMDALIMNVAGLSAHSHLEKAQEVANECRRLNKALKECQELSALYNNRERLFGMPITNYDKLARLIKDFEPYRNLWVTTSDWLIWYDRWMNDPISSIDAENIEKNVTDSYKAMHKAIKQFAEFENDPNDPYYDEDLPYVQQVAVEIKNQIEDFRPNIPLIQALRNPGMRNRHWEKLTEELKLPVRPKKDLTFRKCLEMGFEKHIDIISKVAENAGKEYAIEQALDKMENEWKPVKFEVLPHRASGTFIIKASDDISQLLDDHIVMTQSMSFSPFKKAFEERISSWENKLKITQDVLDEWLVCQRSWLYLEPIFSSEDIIRQLPVESKRYQTMERIWRKIMKNAKENPEVIQLCPDARLRDQLKECNKLLEQVQKGLSEYLETKRSSFPRFYFLSDDELLEILSQTKDPHAVQPHLRKCFENINKVKFESDMRISTMYSAENEEVLFRENIYPTGNVEDWMLEIERVMKESMRQIIRDSLEDYKKTDRTKWVLSWPGQIVIAGCQTYWTSLVSKALEENNLAEYHKKQLAELDALRELVRGKLTAIGRQTLSALIVIEVHARDVVINLLQEKVSNVNDFEWISQLRYYWNNENLYIRAVNAEFLYGYEYLGNTTRLVITPLTDRCYLTLTGALHLKFGGAPAGPAGTGKTETTKDLAKAMAIQCVVFNCSDQLDFMAMGKFFKGLASAGAWACFDEFNRIDIEVLSVVAQQIQQIQQALTQRAERFIFEGVEIALRPSCAVFITMNPGYAGRTELPDNLKALFRPVAMMVPDYALIAEISLFSFGFSDAKILAKKIVTTFKLSSEQLSSQDHYDFGMRAVKSVISAAGNLKRQNPDTNEELICLRAIRDVNVPKFLQEDLKLFNGIVSDLFPKIKEEPIDYGALESSLRKSCKKLDIKDVDQFVLKCIQLYETIVVRHGLMLVGPTGSGKTKCYETLKAAMSSLAGQPSPAGTPFEVVHTYILNPKSITMGQLYGEFDLMTHEWTDGILSILMKDGVNADNDDKRWYVFDGPVDAVWIENMNTVLDDNKKLCLTSGTILKMTDAMTMMFEVADLAVASPATVSRCGMVYLEPSILGIKPFVECWIRKLPDSVFAFRDKLNKLFDAFLEPSLQFLRKNVKEIIPTMDSNLTFSLLKLMDCFLAPYRPRDMDKQLSAEALERLDELIEPWFMFSLIWSVGASCNNDGRQKFNHWLRERMEKEKLETPLPKEGSVYDYLFDDGGIFNISEEESKDEDETTKKEKIFQWRNWMSNIPELVMTHDTKFSDIIVPTIDNIRNAYLVEMLLKNDKTVLCVGPTGTGKTLTIGNKLTRSMPKEYSPEFIVFSAKTSANQTQDLIDSKLDKRRKGIYGPPLGKVFVFFIDDLNMPALEVFGAQPPIELIRQWMDFKGWYDRKAVGEFRNLVDINFCCAMGPPGGGRNPVTLRLTRHFNHLSFVEMEDSSMKKIFGTILDWWIKPNEKIAEYSSILVDSCISVYKTISAQLLPTPVKSHYTFNLRDLSKNFQGILMADAKSIGSVQQLLKLWYHESCRVFQDRLINTEDRGWFDSLLQEKMQKNFNLDYKDVITNDPVIFCDFMIPNADPKIYAEIDDFNHMKKVIEDSLEDYNQVNTAKMRLVLFLDAMKHITRISRIIRQPFGNALLLGVGGSGRQSLTRLASHMAEYECFQIELSKNYGISEWRDDLKKVMLAAGLNNTQTVFLFSDTQIKSETFLEDLNNILNSGDVPNIYQMDELDQIYTAMKSVVQEAGLPPTKTNLFSSYTKRVRNNLHSVICMSPIGEVFRARLRQFPALVNCCTIDWFSEWPKDALESVAMTFLQEMPDLEASDEVIDGLMNICQEMHQTVVVESIRYKEEQGRFNYVTPTSYLELLRIFSKIFGIKKNELIQARKRTKTGLDKLLSTEKEVTKLRGELEQMQPLLEEAVQEAISTMETISVDSQVAAETRATVQKEEEEAAKKTKEAKLIADDAQRDLDEALPALEQALQSLKSLNRNDVTEVKAMRNPPDGVRMVLEAVCIMKRIQPKKVAGDKPGTKVDDYTEPARNILTDPGKFLESLFAYDKENIPDSVIQKIEPYINNDKFTPAAIAQVSKACTSICLWVRAMYKYYFVNRSVAPKREAQQRALEELSETQRTLANAKAKLKEVEEKLATLQAKYEDSVKKKSELEFKVKECEEKVIRAGKLVSGLGDEKVRWAENVKQLEYLISNVIGDVLAASGFIAYLGPFTGQYRESMLQKWIEHLTKYKVPHTESPEVVKTLGDPVKIRNWQLAGLPKDTQSIQNGIIVQFTQRWPLFIDPQGQANKWIKNLEKDNGLDIIKLSDRDFLRSLENAIRFGKPCLLENVTTELDPALEPVLLRQTYKQSGNLVIKLGDAIIPYHEDFKFYITTKLPNPHYTPEVSVKVTLINFTLSPSGLEDQMLGCVVAEERPDLEEAKNQLIISNSIMKNELKELEDTILLRLSKSENPVDDIELINALEASKHKSNEIKAKVIISEQTERDIDTTRSEYVPVAVNTQIMFFCVSDLANIDPMYQYSLEWFTRIFLNSIQHAVKSDVVKERIVNINDHFTFNLYTNVCRSLFEKHKLLFAFLLTVRILMNQNKISMEEYRFFLAGGTTKPKRVENPSHDWISERAWGDILTLESLKSFDSFAEDFKNHLVTFKKIFDSPEPHRESIPEVWANKLDSFQRIIVLKCLRPDKVTNAMQDFVAEHIGQRFIEPQTADLNQVYKDSSPSTPLIFVLSQGTDPAADLYKFADEMKFAKKLSAISLGQGQGPRAESMARTAMERGLWVFFQNCHLAPSWMPSLERLVEQIDPEHVHKDFRLWLTSMPSPKFPVMILQNGSKMTVEPPRGIKANLLKSYIGINDDFMNSCTGKVEVFKHLLFSLSLFHGITLERRKFGPLGFNIPYEFTDGDLRICLSQLKMFLMEYSEIPYKVLKYTAGHINYGGRVTDDWDRRCIMNILEDFYNPTVIDENFFFDESKIYHQLPSTAEHTNYMAYIRSLPINDTPEIFGLHDNANITFAQNETYRTLADLLELQPKTLSAGGSSREEVMEKSARNILDKVPKPIDIISVVEKYPVMYEQSMNTVLVQEIIRYNKLLSVIHRTLQDLLKALKGLVVMSQELEEMSNSLFNNQVPNLWAKSAYPSLKPLAAWVIDLVARVKFIQDWIDLGIPKVFWISGFFFPQAFLTGTLQNFARRHVISIDTISFAFEIMNKSEEELRLAPEDGCYIRGLFIEGARWSAKAHKLDESKPKDLFSDVPIIWLIPTVNRVAPSSGIYVCPVYKTLTRAGTLSTTGHSTNFVFSVELPTDKRQTHWIKRGVAMLCALNY